MDTDAISLIVFFEEPFWIGVFERVESGRLSVCKVTFGAEPKDYEVYEYLLKHCYSLRFSSAVEVEERKRRTIPSAGSGKRRSRYRTQASAQNHKWPCKCSERP